MLHSTAFWFSQRICRFSTALSDNLFWTWTSLPKVAIAIAEIPYSSYQDYLGLSVLATALRFLPAGITGCKSLSPQDSLRPQRIKPCKTPKKHCQQQKPNQVIIVLISFAVSPALSRIPEFYILLFGLTCALGPPLLFAIPAIPPATTYWAYGFPAMCLCLSVEVVWPVVGLLIARELPQEDQALGGGLLQTVNQIGRSLGLAIATAAQTAAQGGGADGDSEPRGDVSFLKGIRAAQWVNVGLVAVSMVIAVGFFHKLGRR